MIKAYMDLSHVNIELTSTRDWSSPQMAQAFVDLITVPETFLTPTRYNDQEPVRHTFDPHNLTRLLDIWTSGTSWTFLKRRKPYPTLWMMRWWYQEAQQFNDLTCIVDERYLTQPAHIDVLLDCVRRVSGWTTLTHGYICHAAEWHHKNFFVSVTDDVTVESTGGGRLHEGLPGIYWANLFGPLYVTFFGREKFLTAPTYHTEELPDGSFLLLTASSPLAVDQAEVQQAQDALMDHLGRDTFFEKAHPRKRCRVPAFTFEQALYGRSMEMQIVNTGQLVYAEADAWALVEQVPVLAAAFVQRRKGKLDYSEASLHQVDSFILRKARTVSEPWADPKQHQLLHEIVAYYGEVLRRRLQGTWTVVREEDDIDYPAIAYTLQGQAQVEVPFNQVSKLWTERTRADGLQIHCQLLHSGERQRYVEMVQNTT